MIKYIVKRVLWMIPVVLGVLLIVFTLTRMAPGDPAAAMLGSEFTQEQYDAMVEKLGLDKPFFTQFFDYVVNVFTKFDMGTSYSSKRPVADEIMERIGTTLRLGMTAVCITAVFGITFGILSATHQYSPLDYGVTVCSLFFASMPNFWMALMMILFFSLKLGWLPATGLESWKSWILPAAAIGLAPVASVTRMTRSSMLEVVRQDYIRTARAKGLQEKTIIWRHALKNALIPVVTILGTQMSLIMGGSAVIETIFSIPGLGTLMLSAINARNYPVIQGCVLVISVFVCIMNLFVDILYAFIDPRIKAQYQRGGKKKKNTAKPAVEAEGVN